MNNSKYTSSQIKEIIRNHIRNVIFDCDLYEEKEFFVCCFEWAAYDLESCFSENKIEYSIESKDNYIEILGTHLFVYKIDGYKDDE